MILCSWEELPEFMRCEEVRPYYAVLEKKKAQLWLKRAFDILIAMLMLLALAVPMIVIAILIKLDSPGPVFYRQNRVTKYGKEFRIHKFRTMVSNADKIGTAVTVDNDPRVTKVGSKIRDFRIDEFPQLIDVIQGNMSFVGTRPEAVKYVKHYTAEMNATLLLSAGITSEASIRFKDEAAMLGGADDTDKVYIEKVLPEKMKWNLEAIRDFSIINELKTMVKTVVSVFMCAR